MGVFFCFFLLLVLSLLKLRGWDLVCCSLNFYSLSLDSLFFLYRFYLFSFFLFVFFCFTCVFCVWTLFLNSNFFDKRLFFLIRHMAKPTLCLLQKEKKGNHNKWLQIAMAFVSDATSSTRQSFSRLHKTTFKRSAFLTKYVKAVCNLWTYFLKSLSRRFFFLNQWSYSCAGLKMQNSNHIQFY